MDQKTTFIATLGGQPQKVTFLLDLLLEHGEKIDQVILVNISSYGRTQNAIHRLEEEFNEDRYAGHTCRLISYPLRSGKTELFDIRTPVDVENTRQSIHQLLSGLKNERHRVHVGLSGGRRIMSMITLAAAMQYLTPVDHLWHIHVPAEILESSRDGKIMHAPKGSEIHLLPVPFVPWVAYFPGLSNLLNLSPREVGESEYIWLDAAERMKCDQVWQALTRRQQEVLTGFAGGLSRKEIALQLHISVATVDSHRDNIIEQCRVTWEDENGASFSAKFLERKFGSYLMGRNLNGPAD